MADPVHGQKHVLEDVLGAVGPQAAISHHRPDEGRYRAEEKAVGCGVPLLSRGEKLTPGLVCRFSTAGRQRILRIDRYCNLKAVCSEIA
jgi:hypothetical protein